MPVAGMGSMFNANGISTVDNVQITGPSIVALSRSKFRIFGSK